jgi:hypothetical protein
MSRRYIFTPGWSSFYVELFMRCALYVCTLAFWLQSNVVERHFHDLLQRYGETVAVDLTDKVRVSSLSFSL